MSYDLLGQGALDYQPCRYDGSRLLFRGPQRQLNDPYLAFIGGTSTYGKFISEPFPALIEQSFGATCLNLGFPNAGLDVFVNDGFVAKAANEATLTVFQVLGAQNLSNRFYSVHPRRNDRFVAASPMLQNIYPEVDFAEFHFTRHMLTRLHETCALRFGSVVTELQTAWVSRMRMLLNRIEGDVVLLWMEDCAPPKDGPTGEEPIQSPGPLFVTRSMLREVSKHATRYVEVVVSPEAIEAGTQGMVFGEMEAPAAAEMLGPKAHEETALQLKGVLKELL